MKIALVGFNFAEIIARLALSLSRDHEVYVYLSSVAAARELTPGLRAALEAAAHVEDLPRGERKRMLWDGFQLARRIRAARVDVVHVQESSSWTIWAMRRFSLSPSWAFALTVHDPCPHSGDEHIRARTRFADHRLRREADAIIVHGVTIAAEMAALEPSVVGRVHKVAHGALGEFAATPPPGAGRFLFFGRIQAYKGLDLLLDAVEQLAARRSAPFEVVVAGVGDDLDRHRARIASLPQVRLDERYVPAEDVAPLFASCDAVVMPYVDATQSGVGALALAAGRCVVATDVGAVGEVVRDGEQGLLVPAGDAQALARAMARILDETGLAARLGAQAKAFASDALAWEKAAQSTLAAYAAARDRVRLAS